MAGSRFKTVHVVRIGADEALKEHDLGTVENLARWIARLLGAHYEGLCDASKPIGTDAYLVRSDQDYSLDYSVFVDPDDKSTKEQIIKVDLAPGEAR